MAVEQRPAAIVVLHPAVIFGVLFFEDSIDRLSEIVPHQNVFGRKGDVGHELAHTMVVRLLNIEQRSARSRDSALVALGVRRSRSSWISRLGRFVTLSFAGSGRR